VHLYGHRQYKVDLPVKASGATNVWFEVWVSQKQPQDGQDVTTGWDPTAVQLLGLNTWTGCGGAPLTGICHRWVVRVAKVRLRADGGHVQYYDKILRERSGRNGH
jgi:hypothetical protein